VILLGRVTTAGPKLTYPEKLGGHPTCSFWVQVDEPGKDGQIYSSYLPVEITGKHAEDVASELNPGDEVCLDGKLKYKTTIGKDGHKRGSVIVTAWFVTRAPTPTEVAG
jgi:single-stranded DNA-binding protein